MPPDQRDPLGSISLNHAQSPLASSSSRKPYIAPKDRPLASIFTSRRRPATPPSSMSHASSSSPVGPVTPESQDIADSPVKKRARFSPPSPVYEDVEMRNARSGMVQRSEAKVKQYFAPVLPTYEECVVADATPIEVDEMPDLRAENVWVRPRRRMGVAAYRGPITGQDIIAPPPSPGYLSTLQHTLKPFVPQTLPSSILLPSLHPPTGRPRDHSPALCVQFNNAAKLHTATSAKQSGSRRLMAIAGEEGGMRIVDVDAPQAYHAESGGWWWRAHANAIFDCQWTDDDSRIMTTSGDQTTRIHALDGPTPTLLATLRGHTASVKTATFFDPSRSGTDASKGPVVATAGRDGNVLIFDMRCSGHQLDATGEDEYASRRTGRQRDRYSAGIPGFSPKREGAELDPVMIIKGAHVESGLGRRNGQRSSSRSVTSIVSLRAMPGMLASGGSADGIVRLWDLRFPIPTSRHPDPKPSHSPALFLPDPTTLGSPSSRRARGIHSIVESPTTGDIYVLAGDSKIHTMRPTCASPIPSPVDTDDAILPEVYSSEKLHASSFYVRMALSPDGRYLACGSSKGGVVAFDTSAKEKGKGSFFELGDDGAYGEDRPREVSSVDWGRDVMAACADDRVTRIWRSSEDGKKEEGEWAVLGGA